MPKALVTGCNGFIASHLCKKLTEEGWDIIGMDLPSFDVTKKECWQELLPEVDYVFHLAGHLDKYYQGEGEADFSKYLDTNAKSVALMFEVIIENKLPIKKIIIASSQSVYGEGDYQYDKPLEEWEDDSLQPLSMYGASKAAMEDVLFTLAKQYKVPCVALRYSIVFGPGQKFQNREHGALRAFVDMAKNGEDVITHEDGQQLRDFIHVEDVVDAHLLVATNPDADYQIFNVGAGKSIKVIELAEYTANKFGVQAKAGGKNRINTARHSLMNIDKLKKLGWEPKRTWQEAVDKYIEELN